MWCCASCPQFFVDENHKFGVLLLVPTFLIKYDQFGVLLLVPTSLLNNDKSGVLILVPTCFIRYTSGDWIIVPLFDRL